MKKEDRIKVWVKYVHHCAYCGKEIKLEDMQVDHFVPKNRGGYPRWSDKEGKYVVSHGDDSTRWIDYCFINIDGRIQNYFPIRIESKRKRGKHAKKIL